MRKAEEGWDMVNLPRLRELHREYAGVPVFKEFSLWERDPPETSTAPSEMGRRLPSQGG